MFPRGEGSLVSARVRSCRRSEASIPSSTCSCPPTIRLRVHRKDQPRGSFFYRREIRSVFDGWRTRWTSKRRFERELLAREKDLFVRVPSSSFDLRIEPFVSIRIDDLWRGREDRPRVLLWLREPVRLGWNASTRERSSSLFVASAHVVDEMRFDIETHEGFHSFASLRCVSLRRWKGRTEVRNDESSSRFRSLRKIQRFVIRKDRSQ